MRAVVVAAVAWKMDFHAPIGAWLGGGVPMPRQERVWGVNVFAEFEDFSRFPSLLLLGRHLQRHMLVYCRFCFLVGTLALTNLYHLIHWVR